MTEDLKHKAFKATIWRCFEVGGRQLISFIVTTILARLIMPEQYGIVAMLSIFMAVSQVFIDSGFSAALIRDTKRTHVDCSTVFYFSIVISSFFTVLLILCAPLIADFYKMPELTPVTRIMALGLVISSFGSVHCSLLSAELNFKKITNISLVGNAVSGVVGIVMALNGFQVWALVIQSLSGSFICTVMYWYKSSWYPRLEFSWKSFKKYFAFGSGLLGTTLINTIYGNSYSLIIGKVFSSATLAFYNRAYNLSNFSTMTPTNVLESVTFPTLVKLQDDTDKLRDAYRRMIRLSAFIIFPCALGMAAIANPLVVVLLTERWMFAGTLLLIISFSQMWYPIHSINLNLLKVCGKTKLMFKLEILKKILGIIMLCITVPMGIIPMCVGSIFGSLICLIINTHYTGPLINFGILKQLKDISGIFILSLVMFTASFGACCALGDGIISLVSGILTGLVVYVLGAYLFRYPEVNELKQLVRKKAE